MNLIFKAIILTVAFTSISAFAGKEGGGGDWTEADFKHFLNRLVPFMTSEEGLELFPEVRAYNKAHPDEPFEKILAELHPRLVDGPVYDQFGNERDCYSGFDSVRYFKCNKNTLPPRPDESASNEQKSEYYGSLYRLNLHEAFVQADLEKPLTKEVASDYTLSSRLSVHLENFPEWVPGKGRVAEPFDIRYGVVRCESANGFFVSVDRGSPHDVCLDDCVRMWNTKAIQLYPSIDLEAGYQYSGKTFTNEFSFFVPYDQQKFDSVIKIMSGLESKVVGEIPVTCTVK